MFQNPYIRVLAGAILISFSPLFVKFVSVGPSAVAFYRCFFGAIALLAVAIYRKEKLRPQPKQLLIMFLAAVCFSADLQCWHSSILLIGPGLSTILANFQVFILALYGAIFLKEKLSIKHSFAIVLAILGLWMLLGGETSSLSADSIKGVGLGLATAVFYSAYILFLRHSQTEDNHLSIISTMGLVSFMAAIAVLFSLMFQDESLIISDTNDFALLALYGVSSQALGWLLISSGLGKIAASKAGLVMLVQPTLSFIWDIILFARPTGLMELNGAILSISSIYIGLSKNKKTAQK